MHKKLLLIVLITMFLSNCSKEVPGDYDTSEVGKIKKVSPGIILSVRPVRLHSTEVKKDDNAAFVDNSLLRSHGYEYVIRLNNGRIISVVQSEAVTLKAKQHILVIYGKNTRIVLDNGSDDF